MFDQFQQDPQAVGDSLALSALCAADPARDPVRPARRPEDAGLDRRADLARRPRSWSRSCCSGCRSGQALLRRHRRRPVRVLPDPVDRDQRGLDLQPDRGVGPLRRAAPLVREGQPRPADPGDHHRLLLRCAARGAGRVRHTGRDLRRDADVAGLQAGQGRGRRAGGEHRAGRLRRAGHPDRHAGRRSPSGVSDDPRLSTPTPALARSMVGRQTPILALFVPLILVLVVDGRRGVRQTWLPALVAGSAFGLAQFVTAELHLRPAHRHRRVAARRRLGGPAAAGVAAGRGADRRAGRARRSASTRAPPASSRVGAGGGATATPCSREPVGAGPRPARGRRAVGRQPGRRGAAYAPYLVIIVIFSITNIPAVVDFLAKEPLTYAVRLAGARHPQRRRRPGARPSSSSTGCPPPAPC